MIVPDGYKGDKLFLDRKGRIIFASEGDGTQWVDHLLKPGSPEEPLDPELVPIHAGFFRHLYLDECWTDAEFQDVYWMYR